MFLLSAVIFASVASVLACLFADNMSSSASCPSGDHLLRQIMRTTVPEAAQVEVFPCKKCPKVFTCQQAMAGHMKGHSNKIPKRSKKSTDHHSKPPPVPVFEHGGSSKRHDPQLDLKGKQVAAAFGLNTNSNPNLACEIPPQFNPNRNLIIREPVMPLNSFEAFLPPPPPPPPPENFIPFGIPIIESRPLAYASLEETYSPPLFNNPDHVTTAYNPVIRYSSNTLVNPLGMYPSKRYVQPSFLQTGYDQEDKDCSYGPSSMINDGAKGSASGEKKHDQELDFNLCIASDPTYKKETADEDLDLELHL